MSVHEELNISVAGAAGQGVQTIGQIMSKVFVRSGLEVFALQDNESRIRGGHNFFQIRVSHRRVSGPSAPLDLLVALNPEGVARHQAEVGPAGIILYDHEKLPGSDHDRMIGLPLEKLAVEAAGQKIFLNSTAIGAAMAVLGWDFPILAEFLRKFYSAKADLAEKNVQAAWAGYEHARKQADKYRGPRFSPRPAGRKMLISGHEAVGLGALAAGCRFYAGYPMSPATSILNFLADKADDFGLMVEQVEDEITAINMAIGASWGGVRAMTATSGGGFSLMVEAFGLTGITETPLVIIEAQRPGPATGMATRTQQADLLFVLHASQDEFPRVILAPGDARQAFLATIKAFDLAEKYQVPVVVLTDHFLADAYYTEERFNLNDVTRERYLLTEAEIRALSEYRRYRLTESGVSPRAIPGAIPFEVMADSHEHDEFGHITENPAMRIAQVEKRFRKESRMAAEIESPTLWGDPQATQLLISWGSTLGAMVDAIDILGREGLAVKGLHLHELWPFPREAVAAALAGIERWETIEGNFTGQLARLIQMELLRKPDALIRKFTGRPFWPQEIATAFKNLLT